MKKNLLILLASFWIFNNTFAQEDFNLELLANIELGEDGNDIWGYVDADGIEYAAVGSRTKVSIYSLEDPSNPILRGTAPGAPSIWRDMKSFGNYIYFTTDEGNDGLGIINMSMAPDSISYTYWKPELTIGGFTDQLRTCHNLYIDENGYAYLAGCNVPSPFNTNGIIILDLNQDPENPTVVGELTGAYSHDVYVRDNIMYCSEVYNGQFAIYDVTDKSNPVLQATRMTSSDYTHNAWLSDDSKYLFTTDEVGNAFVDAYDISDYSNIVQTDKFKPLETAGQNVIPHNTHYYNGYLVTSWYTDGIVITDAHDPNNLVKVASYDTFFDEENVSDPKFYGCWGVYPFLPSGTIIASDINSGFYVLGPNYQRASYIEGLVTDLASGANINGATVSIVGKSAIGETDPSGEYKGGIAESGMFDIEFSHPLYYPATISANLLQGEITTVDAQLQSKTITLIGVVVDDLSGAGIAGAKIVGISDGNTFEAVANANGEFSIPLLDGQSTIYAGLWGYNTNVVEFDSATDPTVTIPLVSGYKDEFVLDLGWTVDGDAATGSWERGEPIGTFLQNNLSNPENDAADDLGDLCYVTGNAGGEVGDDDVDSGATILRSPLMDLRTYSYPTISFEAWFVNAGGNSTPNDKLQVFLYKGNEAKLVYETSTSSSSWMSHTFDINNYFAVDADFAQTATDLYIEVITSDASNSGHIVEAGFDLFVVSEGIGSAVFETLNALPISIYPSPATDIITIEHTNKLNTLKIVNIQGQLILQDNIDSASKTYDCSNWESGTYFVSGTDKDGLAYESKFVVAEKK